MRSFIQILLILGLSVIAGTSSAQGMTDAEQGVALFTLTEAFDPEVDEQGQAVGSPDLNQRMRQGMRNLLLRLTGDEAVVHSPEGQELIADAKKWLSSYHFEPRKEEGVTVGQNLVLEFDRQRLLSRFQAQNIIIWPRSERPKTLVMGSYLEAGTILKLTPENLGYRPDIEFRSYPQLLALPMRFPQRESSWVYPIQGGLSADQAQERLLADDSQYLLTFQLKRLAPNQYDLQWRVYDQKGSDVLSGSGQGERNASMLEAMFDRVMALYSYGYRQSASVLGSATIKVDQLLSTEQIVRIESFLKSQKPTVHQVFLQTVEGSRADFDVVYQGRYEQLLALCRRIDGSELISESALTGEIRLKLFGLSERPETQLIDLSKEYEATMQEEGR